MATRFVKASYQEIIDLHTESGHVTAIGVHTPTGSTPRKMFKGYFDQYKKYKYSGAKITFAPVAKLPADPLSVSYEAGEPTIDPRDLANPILVHGCHGNDMGMILNKLYGDNSAISDGMDGLDVANTDDVPSGIDSPYYSAMERLYYKALTDRTWKKAGIQRGFTKSGLRPLVYTLATDHQIMPSSQFPLGGHLNSGNVPYIPGGLPTSEYEDAAVAEGGGYDLYNGVDPEGVQFFTPRLTRLGWMDTRNVLTNSGNGHTDENISQGGAAALKGANELVQSGLVDQINYAELPKLFMLCILLPPAYKTEMYFRAIITHYFKFKDFRGISFMPEQTGVPSYFNANEDLFDADTFDDIDAGDVPNDDSSGGDSGGGSLGGVPDIEGVTLAEDLDTANEKGGLYSSIKLDGETLTAGTGFYFFVIGGDDVGNENGRVYLVYKNGTDYRINMDVLGSGTTVDGSSKIAMYLWTKSTWVSDTQLVVENNNLDRAISNWNIDSATANIFNGSELFSHVKVLS